MPATAPPPPLIERDAAARPLSPSEARDFAATMRIRPDSICAALRMDSPSARLSGYDDLVADPLKDRFARDATFFAEIKWRVAVEMVARLLPDRRLNTLRALDVGCGTGDLMRFLRRSFGEVRGCDPSSGMVYRAGPRAERMSSALELPYRDHSFDVATCACVYHHVAPHLRIAHLREIRRVLRPGGALLVFEHNPLNPLTRLIVRRCPIDANAQLLDAAEARRLLRAAGYRDPRTRHYMFLPQRLYRLFGGVERLLGVSRLGGQYCAAARRAP